MNSILKWKNEACDNKEVSFPSTMGMFAAGRLNPDLPEAGFYLRIPIYQRAFVNTNKNAKNWFRSLYRARYTKNGQLIKNTSSIFGTVYIKWIGKSHIIITDGHQRLLKVSICLCALRNMFPDDENKDLIESFLYNNDNTGAIPRLSIVFEDDEFAWEYILGGLKSSILYEKATGSDILSFYDDCVQFIRKKTRGFNHEKTSLWITDLLHRICTAKIYVTDIGDLDEYSVFNDINDRYAIPFSILERINGYLFSALDDDMSEEEQNTAHANYWCAMLKNIKVSVKTDSKPNSQPKKVKGAVFIKDFLIAKYYQDRPIIDGERPTVSLSEDEPEMFDLIKKKVEEYQLENDCTLPEAKMEMLKQLFEYSRVFGDIYHPNNMRFTKKTCDELYIASIFRSGDFIGPADSVILHLLYLHSKQLISDDDLADSIRFLNDITARSFLEGAGKGLSQQTAGQFVKAIDKDASATSPLEALKKPFDDLQKLVKHKTHIYSDVETLTALSQTYMDGDRSKKTAKYICVRLELFLHSRIDVNHLILNDMSLEHICPKDLSDSEIDDPEELRKLEANKHMLGNLTLLNQRVNSSCGNLPFSQKKLKYRTDGLEINTSIWNLPGWGNDEIRQRTADLIDACKQNHWLYL